MPNIKKLIDERYSLWEKLLKEDPSDVSYSTMEELRILLNVMGVIE